VGGAARRRSQAYQFVARTTGTASTVTFFADTSNTCPRIVVALYSDRSTHPHQLLTQGSIATPRPGWNSAPTATTVAITKGVPYWIALLCPFSATGTIKYPDKATGPFATEFHIAKDLETFPATWSSGAFKQPDGPGPMYLSQ
jgi:hypothetical protein